ncbi:MAG: hypothetical protein SCALA702_29280 [Melioribacteraceae bacterium]|nr:MAG: hypothetical protein SCALA702_29280 [Melioribacteraceae bacterium]
MKRQSIITLTLFLAVTSFIIIYANSLTGESGEKSEYREEVKSDTKSCCSDGHSNEDSASKQKDMTDGDHDTNPSLSRKSVYQLKSFWFDQNGNKTNIAGLKGKTQVLALIFANCSYACPVIVNDMKKIEMNLSGDEQNNIQFTLISIDPDRDTPERLMKFAKDQNLNLEKWQLLTGNKSDIDDIATLLDFRYKKENDGSYSHSNIISILNEEGELIHQQTGLNQDISRSVEIIKNLGERTIL